ncbi:MAG: PxKF domain-containing protein [Chloroflexi bacterium]|nr:PxKF domain-containing protein [Chloroflexota bacterium]
MNTKSISTKSFFVVIRLCIILALMLQLSPTILAYAQGFVLNMGQDIHINEGEIVSFSGSFNDPIGTSWIATIDYGDGSATEQLSINSGNLLEVKWDDSVVSSLSADGTQLTDPLWIYYEYSLMATQTTTRIEFGDRGLSDSFGTFIDDVSVVALSDTLSNLAINGSFEQPDISPGFSVESSITGWSLSYGSGIEVQRLWSNYSAADGEQYVELDSYSSSGIFQDISTIPGNIYLLRFAYSARPGVPDKILGGNHTYDNGVFVVTVTVINNENETEFTTLNVYVSNVPPSVYIDQITTNGGEVILQGNFSDPGLLGNHTTASVDWGDGNSDSIGSVVSPIVISHRYAEGFYTINLSVIDNDGDVGTATANVVISNNTPSGDNIKIAPNGTSLTFPNVSFSGITTVTTDSEGLALPAGFTLGNPPNYYDIETTAIYSSPVTVCVPYNPAQYSNPNNIRLMHYENNVWVDITSSANPQSITRLELGDRGAPDSVGTLIDNISVASLSTPSQNIIVNGSFEQPIVSSGGWAVEPSILGWSSTYGSGIEIQRLWNNYAAADGEQYVELDSGPPIGISQDILTMPGQVYTLSLAFSPRPSVLDNLLEVKWDGSIVATLSADGSELSDTQWTYYNYNVVGGNTRVICGEVNSLSPFVVAEQIPYPFTGFFQPVDNLPTLNIVNAGRAIPVKFKLAGDQGLNIFPIGYPASTSVACGTTAEDVIEETVTAGSSSLSYNTTTGQYTYVWKTNKAWAGTCRTLVIKLNDGTYHRANFKFK